MLKFKMRFFRIFKSPWEDVRKEMIEEKNLDPEAADRIGSFVRMSGGLELIDTLLASDLVSPFNRKSLDIKNITSTIFCKI